MLPSLPPGLPPSDAVSRQKSRKFPAVPCAGGEQPGRAGSSVGWWLPWHEPSGLGAGAEAEPELYQTLPKPTPPPIHGEFCGFCFWHGDLVMDPFQKLGVSTPGSQQLQLVLSLPVTAVSFGWIPAFSPDLSLYFPSIICTGIPGRAQLSMAFSHGPSKGALFEVVPKPVSRRAGGSSPGCAGWLLWHFSRCPGAGTALHEALLPPQPAGIPFISLAADEKPRPQDVLVHILLGKARGGS